MTRQEAEKRAEAFSEAYASDRYDKVTQAGLWWEIKKASKFSYLASYEYMDAKLREVPWTDEEWKAFSKKQVDQRDNAVVARFEMIQWAEQKIKERG